MPASGADPVANPESVAALLDSVRRLRLTLTADLAAAASAVEADEPEIARDIVAADQLEVRRLPHDIRPEPAVVPARRRRALLALPAIPLVGALAMTGAAAFSSGGAAPAPEAVGHHGTAPSIHRTPSDVSQTAATTLQQLERVVSNPSRRSQVVNVAAQLHDQLSAIIATSPHNARRLSQVRHLLAVEQRLLEGRSGEGVAIALAASRRLAHLLKVSELPTVRSTSAPTSLPHPSTSSSTSAKPKPTTTKSTTPNPQTSTSPPSNPLPTSRPTSPHHHHHHHHHHHLPNPLLGKGLLDNHG